jgi:hypothetical protein
MSAQEVLDQIQHLHDHGEPLTKRKVKEAHPALLKNALYYYPSWEHAIKQSGLPDVNLVT